jgi:hypothetical protein
MENQYLKTLNQEMKAVNQDLTKNNEILLNQITQRSERRIKIGQSSTFERESMTERRKQESSN